MGKNQRKRNQTQVEISLEGLPDSLWLVRHAVAVDRRLWLKPDSQRPLTEKGEDTFKKWLKIVRLHKLLADRCLVIHSDYVRAEQTADILMRFLRKKNDSIFLERHPTALLRPQVAPEKTITWLQQERHLFQDHGSVLLVGHEPHLGLLATTMILNGAATGKGSSLLDLKKGAIVELTKSTSLGCYQIRRLLAL